MDEISQNDELQPSSGAIENFLPTTNEEEMKQLMKDLDKEQAYREHKCWRQWVTVVISVNTNFQFYLEYIF